MLARRMLTFVAVLLALTALAAAFAPPPPRELQDLDSLAPGPSQAVPGNDLVERTLDAGSTEQPTITIEEGDRLHLEVTGDALDGVELRGLAAVRPLGPEALAVFDVIAEDSGTYPVVLVSSNRTIATVEVIPPRREGLAPAAPLTQRTRDT